MYSGSMARDVLMRHMSANGLSRSPLHGAGRKSSRTSTMTTNIDARSTAPVARNAARIPHASYTSPPNSGPSATPTNRADCTAPAANVIRSRGVCAATSAMIVGSTPLVAPMTKRDAISCSGV